jgi:hypothetical protein
MAGARGGQLMDTRVRRLRIAAVVLSNLKEE